MIVIRRGGGRDDPDRRGESAGAPDAAQVSIAHAPAKLCAALEKQISHAQILRQRRTRQLIGYTRRGTPQAPPGARNSSFEISKRTARLLLDAVRTPPDTVQNNYLFVVPDFP